MQQIEQIEREEKQKKVQKGLVPDLTKALTGIPKKYVREAQKFISSVQEQKSLDTFVDHMAEGLNILINS